MSDIDFDELDRAVNGALGSAPSVPESTSDESLDIPVRAETPALNHVERTRMDPTSISVSSSSVPVTRIAPAAPAARRSSGRFMDIVPPSANMRKPSVDKTPVVKPEITRLTSPTEAPVVDEPEPWNEPLESPFLADAKVEKRPLGGNAPAEVVPPFDFQGILDEPEEELLEAPEPQELIEATSTPEPIDIEAAQAVTEEIEATAHEQYEKEDEPTVEEEIVVEQVVEKPTEQPTGPTSITQQYDEQPSSNQESGAIYDTESYHQPVVKPPKKKSSWLIIVWILLLVLLGAAAGWVVYAYVLPML